MKFSYAWMRDLVPGLQTEPGELERLITMKTAECEGVEEVGGHFRDVVVVRVVDVEPLPKGKNRVVTIDTGNGRQNRVVCGAPNVRPGMLAPWVPPGTTLGTKQIGRVAIEGIESEGMLASAAELGLSRDHSGLLELRDAAPGSRLDSLTPDWMIEIDNKSLTHRPDLWGHVGMAREVAAITGHTLQDPVDLALLPQSEPAVQVIIEDHRLCPRYSALAFEHVTVGDSPLWLQARLEHLGLNTINNVVDVSNFILAELPQPTHAFDADKLHGSLITVRRAHGGEQLAVLNGETYTLTESDLVIADAAGPIALAGVIGGAESAISATTKRVVFESANFQASSVRLTSARHKLRTDASMRFEKSLDPENTLRGLARAIELLGHVSPGIRVMGGLADQHATLSRPAPILLPVEFVVRKLGKNVTEEYITGILHALGFGVGVSAPGVLSVAVPSWRATKDISVKDDLVEEVGRMVGYGEIEPRPPLVACVPPPVDPKRQFLRSLRAGLAAQGFTETHNYSFLNEHDLTRFEMKADEHIGVRNPIASELTHLRRSLLPGLFRNVVANVRHFSDFRLFEIGNEIHPDRDSELPDERSHAAAVLYGAQAGQEDFFELKRVVQCLFPQSQLAVADARAYEHPFRTAEIFWQGAPIGRLFELHPALLAAESVAGRAAFFDIDLGTALQLATSRTFEYRPPRRFPTSGFDLSIVAPFALPAASIEQRLSHLAGSSLVSIEFVRQYSGPPLPDGQKSVSYHLEMGAPDHTLSSDEVISIREGVVNGMRAAGFEIRGIDAA